MCHDELKGVGGREGKGRGRESEGLAKRGGRDRVM